MKASPAFSDACGEPKRSSSPATRIFPSSGTVTPARQRMRVDLPAPFAPTSPCTSPRPTPMLTSWSATSPAKCLPRPRISIQASGIPFAPGFPRTAPKPAASETIRVVSEELVDVILGHDDARDRNGLGLPGFPGRDRIEDRLEHGLALLIGGLPDGCGHVAVLDELHPLRAGVAVLNLSRHRYFVIGDGKAGLAFDGGVEGVAAVDAELAGMEGHRQNVGVVADLAKQILGGIL